MSEYPTIPRWMLSFADLLSLLTTFFVLIFSFSAPVKQPSALDKNGVNFISAQQEEVNHNVTLEEQNEGLSSNYLYKVIRSKTMKDTELATLKMDNVNGNLAINLSYDETMKLSAKLSDILTVLSNDIAVYATSFDELDQMNTRLFSKNMKENVSFFVRPGIKAGSVQIVVLQ